MKALRAEGKPLREISETIEKDFHIVMAPMTIKRILDRVLRRQIA